MVDVSKIQVGDEVTIRARVVFLPNEDYERYRVDIAEGEPCCYCTPASFATHTPKPREIEVGDVVTWGPKVCNFPVIALHDGRAWLDGHGIRSVEGLVHADP